MTVAVTITLPAIKHTVLIIMVMSAILVAMESTVAIGLGLVTQGLTHATVTTPALM